MAQAPSLSVTAAGADNAADPGDNSYYTVFRKATAEVLGAIGFGGIIGAFTSIATYATSIFAKEWYANVIPTIASPEGLLLTAAVTGAVGVVSMVVSTGIKSNLEHEQHARDARSKQQSAQVVVVPVQSPALQQEPAAAKGHFVQMLEEQNRQRAMMHQQR